MNYQKAFSGLLKNSQTPREGMRPTGTNKLIPVGPVPSPGELEFFNRLPGKIQRELNHERAKYENT